MYSQYEAILGAAGSGKSTELRLRNEREKNYSLLTSSTGISAVNLGGRTINSVLNYFNTADLLRQFTYNRTKLIAKLRVIKRRYRYIAIDEVSMLDGKALDIIYSLLEEANKSGSISKQLGLILLGDAGQLPVVDKDGAIPFFEAHCWQKFMITALKEIKRQADVDFIRSLNLVREGRFEEALDWFSENVEFAKSLDKNFPGPTIVSRNDTVNAFNQEALARLPGDIQMYPKEIHMEGDYPAPSEWKNIPPELVLKPGAQVMLLSNDHTANYANGDLGKVVQLYPKHVSVRLSRTKDERLIEYKRLECKDERGNTRGYMSYIPLRLAYAMTVFKSQSLTLDKVQIRLTEPFLGKLSGGLYTALSRSRTPEGIRLVGTRSSFIQAGYINPSYLRWVHLTRTDGTRTTSF